MSRKCTALVWMIALAARHLTSTSPLPTSFSRPTTHTEDLPSARLPCWNIMLKFLTKSPKAKPQPAATVATAAPAAEAAVADGASSRKGLGASKRVQGGLGDMDIVNDEGDGRAATSSSSSSSSAAAAAAASAKAAAGSSRGKAGTATGAKSSAKGGKSGKSGKSGVCVCVVTCCG